MLRTGIDWAFSDEVLGFDQRGNYDGLQGLSQKYLQNEGVERNWCGWGCRGGFRWWRGLRERDFTSPHIPLNEFYPHSRSILPLALTSSLQESADSGLVECRTISFLGSVVTAMNLSAKLRSLIALQISKESQLRSYREKHSPYVHSTNNALSH